VPVVTSFTGRLALGLARGIPVLLCRGFRLGPGRRDSTRALAELVFWTCHEDGQVPAVELQEVPAAIQLDVDDRALAWLRAHPSSRPKVISYEVHRCCGGGKLCTVAVRELGESDRAKEHVAAELRGETVLVDRRAASRLPARFGLTVRGIGRFRHLDLDLTPEQWGDLLYS
jgi:hypothetical protein